MIAFVMIAAPIYLQISAMRSSVETVTTHLAVKREHFFLFAYMAQLAVVSLALWCFIFVRQEPALVRIALVLIVLVSAALLWVHKL